LERCFLYFGPNYLCSEDLSPIGEIIDPGTNSDGYVILEGPPLPMSTGKGGKGGKGNGSSKSKGGRSHTRLLNGKSSAKAGSAKGKSQKGYLSFPGDETDGMPMPIYLSPMAIEEVKVRSKSNVV
jgi:hypothetical protein